MTPEQLDQIDDRLAERPSNRPRSSRTTPSPRQSGCCCSRTSTPRSASSSSAAPACSRTSEARQLLSQAQLVEQSSIVEPAVAATSTARSGRNSALVGGLIGLLLGCAAALLADPFLARRARTA